MCAMTRMPPPDRPSEPRRIVVADLSSPRRREPPKPRSDKPEKPLFFYGPRGETTLNWRHWAAPLIMLINIVTLPLVIIIRLLDIALHYTSWHINQAKQRRNNRSDKS
ncbi:MAG: hypothetical protein C0519_14115 [Hyphomicrobium sp.]|nr:hypothetical protein [Hyphomicrobium sp.]PPD06261.1 MAG: hypothetical protein CTY28_14330 [Hyphomicrobium sp.]